MGRFNDVNVVLRYDARSNTLNYDFKLVTGAYFTGTNNWAWVELARAYMLTKALIETGRA
ncbi:hypothetical protein [Massilia sp. BKSP1R2A-1]|jgi:hypothetical protein|uniref:hypothetical protein n=1 Tax=Massilia sp. BKSP1R2A-1 TaxID=3422595 RepID=UPI003D33C632